MVITSCGFTCFRLQAGDTVLALDPFGKGKDVSAPRFEARIALLSQKDEEPKLALGGKPIIFSTAGEYDASDISIVGCQTPEGTAFFIEWEGIHVLHVGMAVHKESLEKAFALGEDVDILFAPAGGPASDMQKFVNQVEPRIVIPMTIPEAKKNALETLIKELGEKPERLDRLSIKEKMLPQEGTRLVVLDASHS